MKLSTKIAIGLFGVGLVAIAADAMWKSSRPGALVLFAPIDAPLEVQIDGAPPITLAPGEVRRIEAAHGAHTVRTGDVTRTVAIESGRDLRGVPAGAEQCFVELDVTLSHYGETAGRTAPTVTQTFRHAEPFPVAGPDTWALTRSDLPAETTDQVRSDGSYVHVELVHMFRAVPCAAMDAGGEATLAALGDTL